MGVPRRLCHDGPHLRSSPLGSLRQMARMYVCLFCSVLDKTQQKGLRAVLVPTVDHRGKTGEGWDSLNGSNVIEGGGSPWELFSMPDWPEATWILVDSFYICTGDDLAEYHVL